MSEAKKRALVTGGGTGIGAASCRALAAAGIEVAIHCNQSVEDAEALAAELPGAFVVQADLASTEAIDRLHDTLKERGGVDILVNNAGMTIDAPIFTAKVDDLDRMLATNVRGTWYLIKRLSRLMIRKRQGRIINLSSVVASTGNVGQAGYGMTKAAIENLTMTAAMELAPYGILVNAIAPGFIRTRMTEALDEERWKQILALVPLGRAGTPEEVAEVVRFLALEGGYITGTTLHVNGGLHRG